MRLASLLVFGVAPLALRVGQSVVVTCPATGDPAPSVITLIASKEDPESEAWVVKPDCSFETVTFGTIADVGISRQLRIIIDFPPPFPPPFNPHPNPRPPASTSLILDEAMGIERVESLPSKTTELTLKDNPISKGINLINATSLRTLTIEGSSIASISGNVFPSTLESLTLSSSQLSTLDGVVFPSGLKSIVLADNKLTSIKGITFPPVMSTLDLQNNQLTTLEGAIFPNSCVFLKLNKNNLSSLNCVFPAMTTNLDLSDNQLTTLRDAIMPTDSGTWTLDRNKLTATGIAITGKGKSLWLSENNISSLRGVAFPDSITELVLEYNSLKAIDTPLPYNLEYLYLYENQITSLKNVWFPPYLNTLYLGNNQLTSVDTELPRRIETLSFYGNRITSLKGVSLPPALKTLWLTNNGLMSLDTYLPTTLTKIYLDFNPLPTLELVAFPDSMITIDLQGSNVTTVRGVRWPRQTSYFYFCFDGCGEVSFEIRDSDLPAFAKYTDLNGAYFEQNECSNPDANLEPVDLINLCVLDDYIFEELYPLIEEIVIDPSRTRPAYDVVVTPLPEPSRVEQPPQTTVPRSATPTPPPTQASDENNTESESSSGSGSGSGSEANVGSVDDDVDVSTIATVPRPTKSTKTTEPEDEAESSESPDDTAAEDESSSGSGVQGGTKKKVSKGVKGPLNLQSNSTESGSQPLDGGTPVKSVLSSNVLPVVIASVSAALFLLMGVCVYRLVVAKRRRKANSDESNQYTSLNSPVAVSSDEPAALPVFLTNDVRNDEGLMVFGLDEGRIQLHGEIARSGSGVVFRGALQGREVVVKRVVGSSSEADAVLVRFMNEIRVSASLDHPKIVSFVGFTWSGSSSLSSVVEFMAGGDLYTVLLKHAALSSPEDWSSSWTPNNINSKASIAQDVAEAVVYLHSLQTPIIHRNLKARNVLLDAWGNAKLSGFDISREVSIEETMTREVGSAAWIAPEVLRGERYSEKADVYSLGVLLVELDSCQHPYAAQTSDATTLSNVEMARLVSTGELRPQVTSACPEAVTSLVAKCLAFDAEQRPTVLEVAYLIREIRKLQ